ncbi:MAG: TonB-dependent receptor [Crocinitomicaceae bacterium]|nr:TonB-dependent receptor [Crocinitomicaceae bacterium]NGF75142.1 TonB-dependent receptor [Fluviicola sp. SGL-29]
MKNSIAIAFAFISFGAMAQLKGTVLGSNGSVQEPIEGAKVYLLNAKTGDITCDAGNFELILPRTLPDTLVFSALGYISDTVVVTKEDRFINMKVVLFADEVLPEIIVEYRKNTKTISKLKVLAVEEISLGELRKAACCNLSESFETNVSVDVNFTDAVSGARTIQMMGLEGVYTQIQFENIPYLRGLEQPFGLSSFPGTWINSIQITKGTGNVVNGYESMAGLVNIEMFKPQDMDAFFLNGYGNIYGRAELNAHGSMHVGKKWSTALFAHGSGMFAENNHNHDNFMDAPMGTLFSFNNRWHYQGEKMEAQIGVNSYLESKYGGEVGYRKGANNGLYGMETDAKHLDVYAKTGFFMKKPYNSIGVIYNLKYQENDALFGVRQFRGVEKRGYVNGVFESIIGNTMHKYKVGLSGVFIDMDQQMDSLTDNRVEIVPGAFAEYTYTGPRLTTVIGARGDYHNLYNFQFSPRVHAKYAITEFTDLRVTAGKGWRVPNYMIDNISLLATSRQWIAPTETLPEISWNFGGSLVQSFKLFGNQASVVVDYYHTLFERQLIVDRDENVHQIIFRNMTSKSFSNSFQTEFSFTPFSRFDIRLAYKFLDVRAEYGGQLQQKVMVPKHRGFINVAYHTRNNKWEFDVTASVFGTSRLPVAQLDSVTFTTDNHSKVYPQLSAQITYKHKKWDFYIGGENLTNYRQNHPIIDAENPFGTYFDATRIWAPVMGINVYAGFRYVIAHKKQE